MVYQVIFLRFLRFFSGVVVVVAGVTGAVCAFDTYLKDGFFRFNRVYFVSLLLVRTLRRLSRFAATSALVLLLLQSYA